LDQSKLNQLKDLLSKQVDILTRGMKIHAKIRPSNLEALHTQLESKKQTKQNKQTQQTNTTNKHAQHKQNTHIGLLQTMRISSENVANAKFEEVLLAAPPMYNEKSRQESVWLELHAFYQNQRERAEKEPIVVRIQSFYRSYVQRKMFVKQKTAATLIQANFRGHILRKSLTTKPNTTHIQKIPKPKREIKIESSLRVLTAPRRESNFEDMVAAGFLPPGVVQQPPQSPTQHHHHHHLNNHNNNNNNNSQNTNQTNSKVGAHFTMSQLSDSRRSIVNALSSPAKKEFPANNSSSSSTTTTTTTTTTTNINSSGTKVDLAKALTNTDPHRFIPVSSTTNNSRETKPPLINQQQQQQPTKISIADRTPSWRSSKGTKRDSIDEERQTSSKNVTSPSPTLKIGETRDKK